MAFNIIMLVVCLIAGLALSFGPAAVESILSWGSKVNALSIEMFITIMVMIGVCIVLWWITNLVSKEDSWIYRNVISDGKEVTFHNTAKKVIEVIFAIIFIIYIAVILLVSFKTSVIEALRVVRDWRSTNVELLALLRWIGNMLLSAAAAFTVSIIAFVIDSNRRVKNRHKKSNKDASKLQAVVKTADENNSAPKAKGKEKKDAGESGN